MQSGHLDLDALFLEDGGHAGARLVELTLDRLGVAGAMEPFEQRWSLAEKYSAFSVVMSGSDH
jgi:hypothetical protein